MPRYTKVGLYPLTSNGIDVTLGSGQFRLPDGTAGAPSLTKGSNPLYGFYWNSNSLIFSNGGVASMGFRGNIFTLGDALGFAQSADVNDIIDLRLSRAAAGNLKVTTDGTTLGTLSASKFTTTGTVIYDGITLSPGQQIGVVSGGNLQFTSSAGAGNAIAGLAGTASTWTSGSGSYMSLQQLFTPGSGSGSFAGLSGVFTINGTSSGEADAIRFATKTNVLTGGTIKLLSLGTTTQDAFTGYTPVFSVDTAGAVGVGQDLTVSRNFMTNGLIYGQAGAGWPIVFASRNDGTEWARLQSGIFSLGTHDVNGVAIVRDGAYLQLRLGDGSAVTGAVTASLPVAAAARDGIIAFDTTLNALVYYVGGNRYKLVGTAF